MLLTNLTNESARFTIFDMAQVETPIRLATSAYYSEGAFFEILPQSSLLRYLLELFFGLFRLPFAPADVNYSFRFRYPLNILGFL